MEGKKCKCPGSNRDGSISQLYFQLSTPFKRPRDGSISQSEFRQPQNSTVSIIANSMMSKPRHPVKSGTRHMFVKTRLCTNFVAGKCLKGKRCTFAHGDDDLRIAPPDWQDRIQRMGIDGQIVPERVKTCNFIARGEVCPKGENCGYVHKLPSNCGMAKPITVGQSIVEGETMQSMMNHSSETAQSLQKNNVNPSIDNLKHIYQKSKICFNWDREGLCHFGEMCSFVHGQPGFLRHNTSSFDVIHTVKNNTLPVIPSSSSEVMSNVRNNTPPVISSSSSEVMPNVRNNTPPVIPSSSSEVMPNVRNYAPTVIPGRHPTIIREGNKWRLNRKKVIGIYADWIEGHGNDIPPPTN